MPAAPVRTVHLVDDDDALRDAMGDRLEGTGYAVRRYAGPRALLDGAGGLVGGVVLSDVFMPEMTGLEMLDRLHQSGLSVPVVFMTGFGDVPLAVDAMSRGAVTFLEKPVSASALDKALSAAFATMTARPDALDDLSERERAVLTAGADGLSVKETAAALGISFRTVEHHRVNVRAKLGTAGFRQAVELFRSRRDG